MCFLSAVWMCQMLPTSKNVCADLFLFTTPCISSGKGLLQLLPSPSLNFTNLICIRHLCNVLGSGIWANLIWLVLRLLRFISLTSSTSAVETAKKPVLKKEFVLWSMRQPEKKRESLALAFFISQGGMQAAVQSFPNICWLGQWRRKFMLDPLRARGRI